jgi:hypothetical protein
MNTVESWMAIDGYVREVCTPREEYSAQKKSRSAGRVTVAQH